VIALAIIASIGVAGCGSSNSNSSKSSAAGSSTPASTPASTGSSSSSTGSVSGTLSGAGSTFAAPIYDQWGQNLSKNGLTLNYGALGSGAGIADLQGDTVDFAGSDPPEAASDVSSGKGPVLQFPMAFGAITVSYNLSGVKAGLKLDGKTLAEIFLGTIKTWNDPAIKALNPGVNLPSQSITVVHRSDSSGTSEGFTTFLAAYDPQWTKVAGPPSKTPKWPTGTGAPKNAGVAASIKSTPGAIGYVEQAYALQNGFTYAAVKNAAGQYVLPTLQAASAAAANTKVPADLTLTTINAAGPTSYPITSQTFIIVYKDMCKAGRSAADAKLTKGFINYGLTTGQAIEQQLDYAPLPASLAAKDQAQLAQMQCNGAPIS
jgi:phosphate transport system substrate-binding protein